MNLILIAVISLGAIALVLAAILYVASKKFAVYIRNHLCLSHIEMIFFFYHFLSVLQLEILVQCLMFVCCQTD